MAVSEQQSYSFETSGSQPACCVHMFDVTRAEIPGRETLISPAQASFFDADLSLGHQRCDPATQVRVFEGRESGLGRGASMSIFPRVMRKTLWARERGADARL